MAGTNAKTKKKNFFMEMQESERRFKELGLVRPQDAYPDLLRSARQINFGLLNISFHPSLEKTKNWQPSQEMLRSKKTCIGIDDEMKPVWIRTTEEFIRMMKCLDKFSEVSIAVECHSHRTLSGYIALIQLGTYEHDFLIDPFGLRNEIKTSLKEFLENPNHLKVGHDITNDNLWLQRDFEIFMTGCNDTQILWNIYSGERMTSLLKLIQAFYPEAAHFKSNKQTFSDWRLRPGMGMTWEQEQYAIADAHLTLRIFDQLRYLVGNQSKELLVSSFELTKERLLKLSSDLKPNMQFTTPNDITDALKELDKSLRSPKLAKDASLVKCTPESMRKFMHLFEWRRLMTKILDDKPELILPLQILLQISCLSATAEEVKAQCPLVHPRLWDNTSKPMQAGIISNILKDENFIEAIRSFECHNCLRVGHGPAWSCPFPRNKENYKKWMNRPENRTVKNKQNERRFKNLSAKFGPEKASAAVFPTKCLG